MTKDDKLKLDIEEKKLLKLFLAGKLKRSKTPKTDHSKAKEAAAHFIRKDARVNIRISKYDLDCIRKKAIDEGLPYQTLIASILHKYASGKLKSNI
jgi:predicted DNA binding CopG/RHH family protein